MVRIETQLTCARKPLSRATIPSTPREDPSSSSVERRGGIVVRTQNAVVSEDSVEDEAAWERNSASAFRCVSALKVCPSTMSPGRMTCSAKNTIKPFLEQITTARKHLGVRIVLSTKSKPQRPGVNVIMR